MRPVEPRWPWEPLHDALGGSLRSQAKLLGVDQAQVSRWRREGLTDRMADRCAIRAGLHPAMVWGLEWFDALDQGKLGLDFGDVA